jgi:hypothetical protein
VVATDPRGALPPDLEAWRRLALGVLIQAASDADGHGVLEEVKDCRSAKRFFYARHGACVHHRSMWFGMAGLDEPPWREMAEFVHHLTAYGERMSRGYRR